MSTKGTYLYAHAMYNYAIFYYVWVDEISLKNAVSSIAIFTAKAYLAFWVLLLYTL